MDNTTQTTGVIADELNAYLEQGCAFLPGSGFYDDGGDWNVGGDGCDYWSSTEDNEIDGCNLYFDDVDFFLSNDRKEDLYFSVRLVRE